jgi:hypothetical protein
MEREALAAKEGLVKFQPFIEGEKILLITDHSALQWARTYENSNRRLAAWGAVFSAYAPGLEIIHRPGRVHLNVDPLSRLPRSPLPHISPVEEDTVSIAMSGNLADAQESWRDREPAQRATFAAWTLEEALEGKKGVFVTTRSKTKIEPYVESHLANETAPPSSKEQDEAGGGVDLPPSIPAPTSVPLIPPPSSTSAKPQAPSSPTPEQEDLENEDLDTLEPTLEYWGATNPPPNIHVAMDRDFRKQWVEAYKSDPDFSRIWKDQ